MSVDELTEFATHSDEPGLPRRALVILLTLGLIGAVIAVVLVTQGDRRALAELRIREDRVSVKATGADFERGTEGQALVAGDTVRTDPDGQAQIDYFEGSQTNLDSDTTLVIGALLNEAGTRSVSLDHTKGRLWNRVEKLTSSEDRYEVRTPNAVASVRGTTFVSDGQFDAPNWFFIDFDGVTVIETKLGEAFELSTDECIRVAEDGSARRCTAKERAGLMGLWIDKMIAYYGGVPEGGPSASPSATPSGSPDFQPVRRFTGGGGGGSPTTPAPTGRGRKPSINTPNPDEDEDEDEEESPAPTAAPNTEEPTEEPTATPTETPVD